MRRRESVTFTNMCMVQDAQGRIAMMYHGGNWEGWCLPGGHVEYGESFTDSVIREVYEETGLTIRQPQLCGVENWFDPKLDYRYFVLCYKTTHFTGELRPSEEGEVRWVTLEEIPTLPLAEGMLDKLQVFLRDELSEHFFTFEGDDWISHFR